MAHREKWMDSLRGIAILLVLLWHAPAIPALLDIDMPEWLRSANNLLLPFRMPTLMFLSGLLLVKSLNKPLRTYYLGKLQLVAWPYFLFALLHNVSFEAVAPLWHPRAWIANGYLWFLFFILVYYLVAPLLRRVPPGLVPIACFVAALLLPTGQLPQQMFYFAGFFFAGYFAARRELAFERIVANGWIAIAGGLGAVVLGTMSAAGSLKFHAEFALLSLGGIIAAIYLMRRVGDARWTQPLQFMGRTSLVYYTMHFPVMHVVLLALLALGVRNPLVIAPVLFTVAIAVCTIVAMAYTRSIPPFSWLYKAPLPRSWFRLAPPSTVAS